MPKNCQNVFNYLLINYLDSFFIKQINDYTISLTKIHPLSIHALNLDFYLVSDAKTALHTAFMCLKKGNKNDKPIFEGAKVG